MNENFIPDPCRTPRWDVLLLDDEPGLLHVMSGYLERHGLRVAAAADASAALRLAEQCMVDCVVMDIGLNGEDGSQLLGYFQANHPQLPLIIYSGLAHTNQEIAGFLKLGAARYLNKGPSLAALLRAIDELPAATRHGDGPPPVNPPHPPRP